MLEVREVVVHCADVGVVGLIWLLCRAVQSPLEVFESFFELCGAPLASDGFDQKSHSARSGHQGEGSASANKAARGASAWKCSGGYIGARNLQLPGTLLNCVVPGMNFGIDCCVVLRRGSICEILILIFRKLNHYGQ